MFEHPEDAATIQALLDRLLHSRLPRILDIQARVERGAVLSDVEFAFLKRTVEETQQMQKYVARNPQFLPLGAQVIRLFDDIVRRATENERNA